MISAQTIEKLESEKLGTSYILGARMRRDKTVRDEVLPSVAKLHVVTRAKTNSRDSSPFSVCEHPARIRQLGAISVSLCYAPLA